jgi:hypothetical protein
VKEYVEVLGILDKAAAESAPHVGDMVQISLSPQSRKKFEAFRIQESVKARINSANALGAEPKVRFTAEAKSMNGNNFTLLTMSRAVVA